MKKLLQNKYVHEPIKAFNEIAEEHHRRTLERFGEPDNAKCNELSKEMRKLDEQRKILEECGETEKAKEVKEKMSDLYELWAWHAQANYGIDW